jgi:hypothetical protein
MLKNIGSYAARVILVDATCALILSITTSAFAQGQGVCNAQFACQKACNSQVKPDVQQCLNNRGDIQVSPGETPQQVCNSLANRTLTSCLSKCPGGCTPGSVAVDFMLVSMLYAPPGDKSTNSFGIGTSAGTNQTIAANFSKSTSTSDDFTFSASSSLSPGIDVGVDTGASTTVTTGSSTTTGIAVTTTTTTGTNLASTSDLEDHDADVFLLWLNAELVVTQTSLDTFSVSTQIAGTSGYMDVMPVTVGQLKNGIPQQNLEDQKICPPQEPCFTVPGLHVLTAADKAAILAMDPFLTLQPTDVPPSSRYLFIESAPLENVQDSGGVTKPFQVSDSVVSSTGLGTTTGGGTSVNSGASFKFGGIGWSDKETNSWTWSVNESTTQSSGTIQTASVTLSSNTPGCCANTSGNGICEVNIYEDTAFRTFAFQPQPETCALPPVPGSPRPSLTGTVVCDQQPCQELIMIEDSNGKVLHRVLTDSKGRYAVGSLPAGPVKVVIGSQTKDVQIEGGKILQIPDTRIIR